MLEKQLEWEKLRSHAPDTMINVAERELHIEIRKKPGTKSIREIIQGGDAICLTSLCRLFGYSRQAFYKHQKKQFVQLNETRMIVQQVLAIRKQQPRCGGRKLLVMLQPFFKQRNIVIGRDAFFALLSRNNLLVRKQKRRVHTTNSKHFFYRYRNLVKDFTRLHAHELWVADITCIPLREGRFAYFDYGSLQPQDRGLSSK